MSHREMVTEVARSLGLLDGGGKLLRLDSLMIVDFALALEDKIGAEIPPMDLAPEVFTSLDAVAELLTTVVNNKAQTAAT